MGVTTRKQRLTLRYPGGLPVPITQINQEAGRWMRRYRRFIDEVQGIESGPDDESAAMLNEKTASV